MDLVAPLGVSKGLPLDELLWALSVRLASPAALHAEGLPVRAFRATSFALAGFSGLRGAGDAEAISKASLL